MCLAHIVKIAIVLNFSGAHPDRCSRTSWAPCHNQRQSPLVECSLAQTFPETTCSPKTPRAASPKIGEATATGADMVVEVPFTRRLAKQPFFLCFGMSESTCFFLFRVLCSALLNFFCQSFVESLEKYSNSETY